MRLTTFAASIICGAFFASAQSQQQVLFSTEDSSSSEMVNVAVIGAGAAGSSAAYYLSQYAANASLPINITVFERESYVGGRSTTVNAYEDPSLPIELGASIFVKVNHILVEATETFNLSTSSFGAARSVAADAPSLGIWDSRDFVVTLGPSGASWWEAGKLLLKYGLSPIRTMRLMKSTVGRFLDMYNEPIFPFNDLRQAVIAADLLDVTSSSGVAYLSQNGISDAYAHDVIQASTRVNYAQNLGNFHGLETMVCMATEGAMAIEGGNWQIFDHMIAAADATLLLNTTVTNIEGAKHGGYQLTTADVDIPLATTFDSVVIAAPFQYSGITLDTAAIVPPQIDYVKLHVTLFTSPFRLRPTYFYLTPTAAVPRTVLTTTRCESDIKACFDEDNDAPNFFSISLLDKLTNPYTAKTEYAYKVFSHVKPSDEWLRAILDVEEEADDAVTWTYRKVWHSYPMEVPTDQFAPVMLDDNLFYTGGMESFISTMETNALMGKNVARSIVDKWASIRRSEITDAHQQVVV